MVFCVRCKIGADTAENGRPKYPAGNQQRWSSSDCSFAPGPRGGAAELDRREVQRGRGGAPRPPHRPTAMLVSNVHVDWIRNIFSKS